MRLSRGLFAVGWAAFGLALFAERQPYERYQSVVDRQMFGQPPPGFDPTKNPNEVSAKDAKAKDQELTKEQVKSAIHFSMVNVTPAGDTAVGFTDNSDQKNPRHYYLKVGESRDGWTVKEADPLAATMTIAKGDVEVALALGGNSANGAGTTRNTSAAAAANAATSHRSSALASRSGGLLGGGGASRGLESLRGRRALREQARAEERAAAEEKARLAAEQEAQREAERAAEREQHERDREEQRAQLMQIQEELKKAREERERSAQESADSNDGEETPKEEVRDEV